MSESSKGSLGNKGPFLLAGEGQSWKELGKLPLHKLMEVIAASERDWARMQDEWLEYKEVLSRRIEREVEPLLQAAAKKRQELENECLIETLDIRKTIAEADYFLKTTKYLYGQRMLEEGRLPDGRLVPDWCREGMLVWNWKRSSEKVEVAGKIKAPIQRYIRTKTQGVIEVMGPEWALQRQAAGYPGDHVGWPCIRRIQEGKKLLDYATWAKKGEHWAPMGVQTEWARSKGLLYRPGAVIVKEGRRRF